jgi:hypothetical protein
LQQPRPKTKLLIGSIQPIVPSEAKSFPKPPKGCRTQIATAATSAIKQQKRCHHAAEILKQLLQNNVVKEKQYLVSLSMDLT